MGKIARIKSNKSLTLEGEIVEDDKTQITTQGDLTIKEIIEYPPELEGGRNLVQNSNFKLGFNNYWDVLNNSPQSSFIIEDSLLKVTKISTFADFGKRGFITLNNLGSGDNIIVTTWVKGSGSLEIRFDDSSNASQVVDTNTIEKHIFTISSNSFGNGNFIISVMEGEIYFERVKVEKGTKATDWTPAPEDLGLEYSSDIQYFNMGIKDNTLMVTELIEGVDL